jgi:hypothetical protein
MAEESKLGGIAGEVLKSAGYQTGITLPTPDTIPTTSSNGNIPAIESAPVVTASVPATPPEPAQPVVPATPATEVPKVPETPEQPVSAPETTPSPAEPAQPGSIPPTAEADIDDAKLLATLSKKLGRDITSLDDLKEQKVLTPEEIAEEQDRVRNQATSYGLENKLFNRKDLDAFAIDKAKSPRDTALLVFGQELKAINPNITDEEIGEQFSMWAFEHEEEGHPLRTMMNNSIQSIHNDYINNKYAAITNVEQAYNQYSTSVQSASDFGKRIDRVFNSFTDGTKPYNMQFSLGEGLEYNYEVKPEVLNEIKAKYQNAETFNVLGDKAKDDKFLADIITNEVKSKEFNNILFRVAEAHSAKKLLDVAAERQGIVPKRDIEGQQGTEFKKLTGIAGQVVAAAN